MRRTFCALCIATAVGGLAACDQAREAPEAPATDQAAASSLEPPPQTSIMRPEVLAETQPEPPPPPDPIERQVLFDVASADLSEDAGAGLDELLKTEGMSEGEWTIRLTGRTDPSGSAEANLRLSQQRAEAVRDYLIEGGVPAERVQIAAAGEPEVEAPSDDESAMAEARRVDVRAEPVVDEINTAG